MTQTTKRTMPSYDKFPHSYVQMLVGPNKSTCIGIENQFLSVGQTFQLNGKGVLLQVLYCDNDKAYVLPASDVNGQTSCNGCLEYDPDSGKLGKHCLLCRRQYPGQPAFDHKPDYYWPESRKEG